MSEHLQALLVKGDVYDYLRLHGIDLSKHRNYQEMNIYGKVTTGWHCYWRMVSAHLQAIKQIKARPLNGHLVAITAMHPYYALSHENVSTVILSMYSKLLSNTISRKSKLKAHKAVIEQNNE